MGGQLADLVVSGQLAYVATGRVVAVWDYQHSECAGAGRRGGMRQPPP